MAGEGASTPHPCLRGPFVVEVEIAGRRLIVKRFPRMEMHGRPFACLAGGSIEL
jgi:hypothetical protein